ncbi:hypothetical protein TIFTF001_004848 [Ficus carica]|uniref:Vacuolar ATPase assembly protein VMA22 n=1 Tax=Ficus carica TaxID=3494 RepID=A0AA88CXW2_FICCA|nr:hypothetical protein TIFTF001_004848 [Ficus carica]
MAVKEEDSHTQCSEAGEYEEEEEEEENDTQNGEQNEKRHHPLDDRHALQFLDSLDDYLIQMDSLSSILRQGWLELASARHSMGASRVNGALLDLKFHNASTSLRVTQDDDDSGVGKAHFTLSKWASSGNGENGSGEGKLREDKSPQLRHRSISPLSETPEKTSSQIGASLIVDEQVQKERLKSLSVFGTLVSPKLRTAQLSFETALGKLVEIANTRSTLLSAFDQVKEEIEGTKD